MTFDEIVAEVMDRLNLTSDDAMVRIEKRVNDRYRRVTSSIGLITSRRLVTTVDCDSSDPDTILPDVLIPNLEKVLKVSIDFGTDGIRVLKAVTFDELSNVPTITRVPRAYADKRMGAHECTITLDAFPVEPFTLTLEGYELSTVLADDAEPFLPEDFHDILVAGAMADELDKMEKPQLAQIQEAKYETRLSDLRMFIAKHAYLDIVQGKDKPGQLWYRPWYSRISLWN